MTRITITGNGVECEGLEKLLGKKVTLFCLNYIYTGTLVGVNGAMAVETLVRRPPACEGAGPWWVVAVLPSFLASFSCCAPTVLLLLGAGAAGAVISVIPFAVPAAALLLAGSVLLSARRLERTLVFLTAT